MSYCRQTSGKNQHVESGSKTREFSIGKSLYGRSRDRENQLARSQIDPRTNILKREVESAAHDRATPKVERVWFVGPKASRTILCADLKIA